MKTNLVREQWEKLTPRERIIKFHMANSPVAFKTWTKLSDTEKQTMTNVAHILGFDCAFVPEPSSFRPPSHERVETRK